MFLAETCEKSNTEEDQYSGERATETSEKMHNEKSVTCEIRPMCSNRMALPPVPDEPDWQTKDYRTQQRLFPISVNKAE